MHLQLHSRPAIQSVAVDRDWSAVYAELTRIAQRYARLEAGDRSVQPAALVNEAYVRLADTYPKIGQNRAEFLAVAATAMRHILVDDARRRRTVKHGGDRQRVPLNESSMPVLYRDDERLDLDETLRRLDVFDPNLARLVELRFFGGLTFEETARKLKVSPITAKRMWRTARDWIRRRIESSE